MNIAINQSTMHENTLIWAIICSILLHGLLAVFIPNIKFDEVKKPEILEVELITKQEPPPAVQPEPVQPQPEVVKPQPEPLAKPKPVVKPAPAPVVEKAEPIIEQPAQTAPPPDVIAVAPKAEAAPSTLTVPAPDPIKQEPPPPAHSQPDINAAKAQYGNVLLNAINKHKKYPNLARMRGWEGEVVVEMVLDSSGKIKSKRIAQPSGHEALDKAALEMVEKASPFPIPPEILRNGDITITVPVPFHLENA